MPDPIPVYIGDDWSFPITLKDADGDAIDLTGCSPGGELWRAGQSSPVTDLTIGNGGVTLTSAAGGTFSINVDREITLTMPPPVRGENGYPTRIQVYIDDPNGERQTYAILYLKVLDPRTA